MSSAPGEELKSKSVINGLTQNCAEMQQEVIAGLVDNSSQLQKEKKKKIYVQWFYGCYVRRDPVTVCRDNGEGELQSPDMLTLSY